MQSIGGDSYWKQCLTIFQKQSAQEVIDDKCLGQWAHRSPISGHSSQIGFNIYIYHEVVWHRAEQTHAVMWLAAAARAQRFQFSISSHVVGHVHPKNVRDLEFIALSEMGALKHCICWPRVLYQNLKIIVFLCLQMHQRISITGVDTVFLFAAVCEIWQPFLRRYLSPYDAKTNPLHLLLVVDRQTVTFRFNEQTGCVLYVRQRIPTHTMIQCIEINVTNFITYRKCHTK